jgi:hypothetical protein
VCLFLRGFFKLESATALGLAAGELTPLDMLGVTLILKILSFFISYYLFRIKNPITLLATVAGGHPELTA